jgi:hypothetical protein
MASSKKPTLDDFLKKGKRPPTRGRKAPPDYDVITPDMGYTKPTKKKPPVKLPSPPARMSKSIQKKVAKQVTKKSSKK